MDLVISYRTSFWAHIFRAFPALWGLTLNFSTLSGFPGHCTLTSQVFSPQPLTSLPFPSHSSFSSDVGVCACMCLCTHTHMQTHTFALCPLLNTELKITWLDFSTYICHLLFYASQFLEDSVFFVLLCCFISYGQQRWAGVLDVKLH